MTRNSHVFEYEYDGPTRSRFASKCIRILIFGIMNCGQIHPNYATETEQEYFTNTLFLLALK